jgi:hypothetical protein
MHDNRFLILPRPAVAAILPSLIAFSGCQSAAPPKAAQAPKISGLIMSIEFEGIDGVRHWERELNRRGLAALVQAQDGILRQSPGDFRQITWWRSYEAALDRSEVVWRGFDDWIRATKMVELAYADLPVNREVKYDVAPRPAVPLEQLEDIPGVRQNPGVSENMGGLPVIEQG